MSITEENKNTNINFTKLHDLYHSYAESVRSIPEYNEEDITIQISNINTFLKKKINQLNALNKTNNDINDCIQIANRFKDELIKACTTYNDFNKAYHNLSINSDETRNIMTENGRILYFDRCDKLYTEPKCVEKLQGDIRNDKECTIKNRIYDLENIFLVKDDFIQEINKKVMNLKMSSNVSIQPEIHKSNVNLNKYKKIIHASDKVKLNYRTCTICYDKEADHALVPCGHTFCKTCSEKTMNFHIKKCGMCNGICTSNIKIYYLGEETPEDEVQTSTEPYSTDDTFSHNYAEIVDAFPAVFNH